ncbi:DeoR family regulatory protein [Streptococcus parauberis]|nr:DeoR family regulatory protein [Streptococcus parauberis KCTC 11537]GAJ61274.1 DeoR family regulatory protein [Streptococcus parauberis]
MNRLEKIIQLVSKHQKIDVNTLSRKLAVSKVTIRKDLDKLEGKGLLHREHGYAVLNSGDDLNVRLSYNYNIKRKIAEKAAAILAALKVKCINYLVTDEETIKVLLAKDGDTYLQDKIG